MLVALSKRAPHPYPTPRPRRPPCPRRRCAAATRLAVRRHALELLVRGNASLASCASSHVPSSHDCCCSRCAYADELAGIVCAPAGWERWRLCVCSLPSGLFRSPTLQSRCFEAAMFATDLRRRLCRLSARRLPSLLRRSHILWRCCEGVPWVFGVLGTFWYPDTFTLYFFGSAVTRIPVVGHSGSRAVV